MRFTTTARSGRGARLPEAPFELSQLTHASGLGLVYVAWVVRFSEGTLGFSDRETGGTIVTIDLPVAGT